jgi:hypothetical protein
LINIYPLGAYEGRPGPLNGPALYNSIAEIQKSTRQPTGRVVPLGQTVNSAFSGTPARLNSIVIPALPANAQPNGSNRPSFSIYVPGANSLVITGTSRSDSAVNILYPALTLEFLLNNITVAPEHPYGGQSQTLPVGGFAAAFWNTVTLGWNYRLNFDTINFRNYDFMVNGTLTDFVVFGYVTTGDAELISIDGPATGSAPSSSSAVLSVQSFSITLSGGALSNTAAITAVGSKAVVIMDGATLSNVATITDSPNVVLTNPTTVTATRAVSGGASVSVVVKGFVIDYA